MMLFIICSDGWKSATTVWLNYLKIWSSYPPWSNIVRLIFVIFSQPNAIKSSIQFEFLLGQRRATRQMVSIIPKKLTSIFRMKITFCFFRPEFFVVLTISQHIFSLEHFHRNNHIYSKNFWYTKKGRFFDQKSISIN